MSAIGPSDVDLSQLIGTRELPFLDSLLIDFPTVERPSLGTNDLAATRQAPSSRCCTRRYSRCREEIARTEGWVQTVSNKWGRGVRARQALRRLRLPAVAAIGSFGFFWYLSSSPWPPTVTLRHLAAFPCAAAKMVGLAPSRRGQTGCWDHHDADGDGIACEASRLHTRHSWVPYQL